MGYLTPDFNQVDRENDLVFLPNRNRPQFVDASRDGNRKEDNGIKKIFDAFRKKRGEQEAGKPVTDKPNYEEFFE